jgi:hypothetical protein
MKVSFDFDSTLSRRDVQEFAKQLVISGLEVWIVTSRFDDVTAMSKNWHWIKGQNQKLFDIAEDCGIKIFTLLVWLQSLFFYQVKNFYFI